MTPPDPRDVSAREYPPEVLVVSAAGREFILVGTAHVSRESAELVRDVIERESPDRVCVELDEQRYVALSQRASWERLDLKQLIRTRRLPVLLVNLLMSSYQRRLGLQLGVMPGTELLEAVRVAEDRGIPYSLSDRHIRTTMLRAWRSMSFWKKNQLLAAMLGAMFSKQELSEDDLRRLRQRDVLTELLDELASLFPELSRVLIRERDLYLARSIREAAGDRIVAVVGAGHVDGIARALQDDAAQDPGDLDSVPPASKVAKWIAWSVPTVILGGLGIIGWKNGAAMAGRSLRYWILANSIPSGIGALLALAHPLTVLAAVIAAPITSLIPVIGAGYVTAFVQAWMRPPRVRDLEHVADEAGKLRCWWSNRLLRVLLAFVLPTLGSVVGTWLGGFEIVSKVLGGKG